MKKFKKVFAVILSLAMILGMSMTSFAADPEYSYPSATDNDDVTVSGLQAGDEVSFYKIVKPNFNANNAFTGYSPVGDYKIGNVHQPTAGEITTIANTLKAGTVAADRVVTVEANATSVTATDLTVGTYLVLVNSATTNTIYNPMIASVYYIVNGVKVDNVSAGDNFTVGTDSAYAKKSTVELTKQITSPLESADNVLGNDVAIGDRISFEVTADLPSYSAEYEKITYKITDTLDGLDDVQNIKVFLDSKDKNNEVLASVENPEDPENPEKHFELTNNGTNYTIDFDEAYIRSLASTTHKFIITYDAKLADNAGINYDENNNTVRLDYTNSPEVDSEPEYIEKETYHYTFGIDAEINGSGTYKTGELFKTETGEEKYTEATFNEDGTPVEGENGVGRITKPLAGAIFSLQKATKGADGKYTPDTTVDALTSTSDGTGRIPFRGLDAGSYILKETTPPTGYSLNEKEYYIDIAAEYDKTTGKLLSYSITINDGEKDNVTIHSRKNDDGTIKEIIDHTTNAAFFVNTTIASLPSTGGIGTTIFTIGGCAIMIIAAALFFASRRKSAK